MNQPPLKQEYTTTEIPCRNRQENPVDVSIQQLSVSTATHICPQDHQNTVLSTQYNTMQQPLVASTVSHEGLIEAQTVVWERKTVRSGTKKRHIKNNVFLD